MGWYLRKAFNFGPLRLNLSKSGVGVSAGVKGFRVSSGPRGTHLHAGRGGIYFRQRLDVPSARSRPGQALPPPSTSTEILTADAAQLVDEDAGNLMREINERYRIRAIAPLIFGTGTVGSVLAVAAALSHHPAWWALVVALVIATAVGGTLARRRDVARKTVHLWFDLSNAAGERFGLFEKAISELARSRRVWRVNAEELTGDWKRNAGANVLVKRSAVHFVRKLPPYFESNIRPYSLAVGSQTLYFFPDRVLAYDSRNVGSVSYEMLEIDVSSTNFRETESVPSDAEVVDHTWRYVNKSGGPDRRFSNNQQIPVCRYDEMTLRSPTGLNICLMVSQPGVARRVRDAEAEVIPLRLATATDGEEKDADQRAFEDWRRKARR